MNQATPAIKRKHQRLVLVLIALVAIIGAGLLAAWTLRNQANYFYLPAQLLEDPPAAGQPVRLGGMVEKGSLERARDGVTIHFVVTDQKSARVPVRFRGITPDLFVEGSGVVAEGALDKSGEFVATNLLAKHDENYVPRELEGMSEHNAAQMAKDTTVGLK